MALKAIKMVVKRVQTFVVTVDERSGYGFPDEDASLTEVIKFVNEIQEEFADVAMELENLCKPHTEWELVKFDLEEG